jgi:hypothetical protein
MATGGKDELVAFHRFLGDELASGAETLSPEEYLERSVWAITSPLFFWRGSDRYLSKHACFVR